MVIYFQVMLFVMCVHACPYFSCVMLAYVEHKWMLTCLLTYLLTFTYHTREWQIRLRTSREQAVARVCKIRANT